MLQSRGPEICETNPKCPNIQTTHEGRANELRLKIGIRVSPRTVNKYLPWRPRGRPRGDLRWSTFLRLHAIGTIPRECLDWLIPLSECHLRRILKSWIPHYNSGASAHGAGSRRSRSAAHQSLPHKSKFAPSPRRIICGPCQSNPWRAASRILPRAHLCVTEFLRTTPCSCPSNGFTAESESLNPVPNVAERAVSQNGFAGPIASCK
jgi:hypothetical protein